MGKAYNVYTGIEFLTEPVASFSSLEDAEQMAWYLVSHTGPMLIEGEVPVDIDKYVPMLRSGKRPFDISLYGNGSVFEIDNGFEGATLSEPTYIPDGEGAYYGTFWAENSHDAIEIAQTELKKLQN